MILKEVGFDDSIVNLGEIAGYLHDIGNSLSRHEHAVTGGVLAYQILKRLELPLEDCAEVMMAIGNHDEMHGVPVSVLSAALIIADKSDVHKSRVKDKMLNANTNIHDRVNLAVNRSYISVLNDEKRIDTIIETDPSVCSIADYFEIYDNRMQMCSKAAELLGYKYGLVINGTRML
jgi:metal-dependent HD superfamily phosphatase/phosphodiesterase